MKKSVILVIAVVYVLAIVLVGFIGLNMKVYDPTAYVESITCVSEEYRDFNPNNEYDKTYIDENYKGIIMIKYSEGATVDLKCQVTPDNATVSSLQYISESPIFTITPNEDGTATVTFLKRGTGTVIVKSNDNKGVSIKLVITAY